MRGTTLPPGFRFHPTDEELVGYYLKRKAEGLGFELEVIPVIDLYKYDPWELPEKSFLPKRDMEWFFFCPRDRKYPNGSRTNRATKAGYWKATGKDRKVVCQSATGFRKTLVFYQGRAPLGDRTDYVMHEYRLNDDYSEGLSNSQGPFALCRVVKKNEQTQRTSDSYKEPKGKKAVKNASIGDFSSLKIPEEPLSISRNNSSLGGYLSHESLQPSSTPQYEVTNVGESRTIPMQNKTASFWVSPDLILDSSKEYPQQLFPLNAFPESMPLWNAHEHGGISSSSSYSNFSEEVEHVDDLSCIGYISPYSGHGSYATIYGNEDIPYGGLGTWDDGPICRQASGDGSLGDIGGLWQQEDNLTIVM